MEDSFPLIFSQTQQNYDYSCSSKILEDILQSVPFQKLDSSAIENYKNKVNEKMTCGKAAYIVGFKWPFLPKTLKKIWSATFKDPNFQTIFVLNTFVSWTVFFERTKIVNNYIEVLLSSIVEVENLAFPQICATSFLHMYKILLDSNVYKFNDIFFGILALFIKKNPNAFNSILPLLCSTKGKIDEETTPLMLEAINSVLENVKNIKDVKTDIADNVIQTNMESIIEMNIDALKVLNYLSPIVSQSLIYDIFNEVPITMISLIIKESTPNEWPELERDDYLKLNPKGSKTKAEEPTVSHTFKNGLGELSTKDFDIQSDYMLFSSNETFEKIWVFIQTASKNLLFSSIFINSFVNESVKYKKSNQLSNILAALVFSCGKIQAFLPNSLSTPLLFRSFIFDLSITVFDVLDTHSSMSRLRQEVIALSLKEGYEAFVELLSIFKFYPKMLAEVFYRLCKASDLFLILAKHTPRVIRALTESMEYYTLLNKEEKDNIEEIEETRKAQLTFLSVLLSKKQGADVLYQDVDFNNFFISLIFENNLRSFILNKLMDFFTNTEKSELNYLIGQVASIFIQKKIEYFLDENFCSLILDIIKTLTKVHKNRKGISSIIEPIHEGISIMIQNMPPTKTTEIILFQCINLYTESEEDNILTKQSMEKLSNSIINFYKGSPNEDLYQRVLQLFIGNSSQNQIPEFEIKHKSVLPLFFKVFIRSELSNKIISFLSQLFKFSKTNCIIGHECGIDMQIIEVLNEYKTIENVDNDQKERVQLLLDLFVQIDSNAASPKSVTGFTSLLSKLNNGDISKFNKQFVKALYSIVLSDYNKTERMLHLDKSRKTIVNLPDNQFSFSFWISINEFPEASSGMVSFLVFSKTFVISLEKDTITLTCNDKCITLGTLLLSVWSFINVNIAIKGNKIVIYASKDINKSIREEIDHNINTDDIYGIKVSVIKSNIDAEISYIGLFPLLKKDKIINIYKYGPFMTHHDACDTNEAILFDRIDSEKQLDTDSFTGILSQDLQFKPFMKYFSTISFDSNISTLFVGIITKALSFSPEAQKIFYENNHVLSLAWIILEADKAILTYDLYLSLNSLFMTLSNKEIRVDLFKIVLSDPGWWCRSSKIDHEKIVSHWARVLYPSFMPEAATIRSFSSLLDLLLKYYWPDESIESNTNDRPDLHYCRSNFHAILQSVASVKFTSNDLARLLAQCYSCNNIDFSRYLLLVMNSLLTEFPEVVKKAGITSEKIGIFQFLLNKKDDRLTSDVIETIIQFHKLNIIEQSLLSVHLDALTISLDRDNFSSIFFKRIIRLLKCNNQELLSLCCWFAATSTEENASELAGVLSEYTYNISNYSIWRFWPLVIAIIKPSTETQIFEFLFRESGDEWMNIIPDIYIACKAINADYYRILTEFIVFILDINTISINKKVKIVVWFLTTQDPYTISKPLMQCFGFENEENIKTQDNTTDIGLTKLTNIINQTPKFKFGMRLNNDGKWLDFELANVFINKVMYEVDESCINQYTWVALMIYKVDNKMALIPLLDFIKDNHKEDLFTTLLTNLDGIESVHYFKKIYKSALKIGRNDFEKLFQDEYNVYSKHITDFFGTLLPDFTSSVIGMVDSFNDSVMQQNTIDKEIRSNCYDAYSSLIEE